MFVENVRDAYFKLRRLGIVRSSREYSAYFLGQGADYVRHCCRPGRRQAVPRWVAARLLSALRALRDGVSAAVAAEIDNVLAAAEAADCAARLYYRR